MTAAYFSLPNGPRPKLLEPSALRTMPAQQPIDEADLLPDWVGWAMLIAIGLGSVGFIVFVITASPWAMVGVTIAAVIWWRTVAWVERWLAHRESARWRAPA